MKDLIYVRDDSGRHINFSQISHYHPLDFSSTRSGVRVFMKNGLHMDLDISIREFNVRLQKASELSRDL